MKTINKSIVVLTFLFILTLTASAQENKKNKSDFPVLKGPYLGQEAHGEIPELFAPGIVSTGFEEQFAFFTPDLKEFYYLLRGAPFSVILVMKEEESIWTKPKVAPFSGKYFAKFCLSPDGNKIVMTSTRPPGGSGEPSGILHTFIVERTGSGWSEPKQIKILEDVFAPSIAENGNLYFIKGPEGEQEICMSNFNNGQYSVSINLGDSINSDYDESDPFIAPDESYLIFGSNQKEGNGIYISYKRKDGKWFKAINMGKKINSYDGINCASVSPDGKYLFFFSCEINHKPYSDKRITYEERIHILKNPQTGSSDIYWVSAKIIEDLKPHYINKITD